MVVSLLLIVAFGLGLILSYFNWTPVTFNYLAGRVDVPLIALLLSAFALGTLVMGVLSLERFWKLKRESRRLQRQLRDAETELSHFRHPAKDA
ncbi:MAG: LapA family protein [Nevskiales bacterium]|nr:LapA family protein [Nevskiales bacterium]